MNNQLLWGGLVTGEDIVSVEETMGAVAYDGDLARFADDVTGRSLAMWGTDGVLDATDTERLMATAGRSVRP